MKMTSKTFSAVFALALVLGSDAALPKMGSCTYMEYICSARKCETDFYKKLQKDPKGDCSAKYNEVFNCVTKTLNICMEEKQSASQIKAAIDQNFGENLLCNKGAIDIPDSLASVLGLPCSGSFSSNSSACMKTFHEKFIANPSDPALCREQANAKQCLKELFKSACNLSAQIQEMIDPSFSDHNPFCANNRDPGATGKEQCDGVRDISTAAAAGHKSSALRALLVSFLSLLFLTKI